MVSHTNSGPQWSRRNFLATSAASTMSVTLLDHPPATAAPSSAADPRNPFVTNTTINNRHYRLALDVRTTLLDALREHAGLTGSKKGCNHGRQKYHDGRGPRPNGRHAAPDATGLHRS